MIHALLYFKTVANMQNLTRAAEKLNISPSALSGSIKKLEEDLGVQLFDRRGRNIFLNRFGEAYLTYVERILTLNEWGNVVMQSMQNERASHIRIANNSRTISRILTINFLRANPSISISLVRHRADEILDTDFKNKYDFAIGSDIDIVTPNLQKMTLFSGSKIVAVMNKNHSLADKKSLTLSDLEGVPLMKYGLGTGKTDLVELIMKKAGINYDIVYEAHGPFDMALALDANIGIMLRPEATVKFERSAFKNAVYIPVTGVEMNTNLSLFWDPERPMTEAAQKFFKYCEVFKNEGF